MEILIWAVVAIVCNLVTGVVVWKSIDDENESLYKWYKSCPEHIAWIAQPCVLFVWPVGLWLWWKERNKE